MSEHQINLSSSEETTSLPSMLACHQKASLFLIAALLFIIAITSILLYQQQPVQQTTQIENTQLRYQQGISRYFQNTQFFIQQIDPTLSEKEKQALSANINEAQAYPVQPNIFSFWTSLSLISPAAYNTFQKGAHVGYMDAHKGIDVLWRTTSKNDTRSDVFLHYDLPSNQGKIIASLNSMALLTSLSHTIDCSSVEVGLINQKKGELIAITDTWTGISKDQLPFAIGKDPLLSLSAHASLPIPDTNYIVIFRHITPSQPLVTLPMLLLCSTLLCIIAILMYVYYIKKQFLLPISKLAMVAKDIKTGQTYRSLPAFTTTEISILGYALSRITAFQSLAQKAQQQKETSDKTRAAFFSTLHTQLRIPLNTILNLTHLLKTQAHGPTNTAQENYLTQLNQTGQALLMDIEQLLQIGNTTTESDQSLQEEWLEAHDMMNQILNSVQEMTQQKGILLPGAFNAEKNLFILVDTQHFKQSIATLLIHMIHHLETNQLVVHLKWDHDLAIIFEYETINKTDTAPLFASNETALDAAPYKVASEWLALHQGRIEEEIHENKQTISIILPAFRIRNKKPKA